MAILGAIPVLHCQSIDKTLEFYQQLFQFVVVNKRELNGCLHWVHIMHGDTTLMLQSAEQQNSKAENSQKTNISLYFFINNINELHHFVKVKYKNISDITLTDYQMQEFSLVDPEGNAITVGQKSR